MAKTIRTEAQRRYEKAYYLRNREKCHAAAKASNKKWRENNREEYNKLCLATTKSWLRRNPEKKALYEAKQALSRALGLRFKDLPEDMVQAWTAMILVRQAARRMKRESS
jgi:hypothetical protein